MNKNFLIAGVIFAAVGVAAGAFGAHGLQKITDDGKIIEGYKTAVQYQLWHALALIAVGILSERFTTSLVKWAGRFFIAGILLFSGSLYSLTCLKIQGSGLVKAVGPVTPIGGLFFIMGWLLLLVALLRKK